MSLRLTLGRTHKPELKSLRSHLKGLNTMKYDNMSTSCDELEVDEDTHDEARTCGGGW